MVWKFFGQSISDLGIWSKYWKKHEILCAKNPRSLIFHCKIKIEEKCHIYNFVEQVKLYRLVYDSTWTEKEFEEKSHQKWKFNFRQFLEVFMSVSEADPTEVTIGKSLDRNILDSYMVHQGLTSQGVRSEIGWPPCFSKWEIFWFSRGTSLKS